MPPILGFIGWHDSGKTTLATRVVGHLAGRGYSIGVIKSTKDRGIGFDRPESDTGKYRAAGASVVCLAAPDQLTLWRGADLDPLPTLADRYFPAVDLVIAEGFKHADQVAKIVVSRGQPPQLQHQVQGVIALATDQALHSDLPCFQVEDSQGLADFIQQRLLSPPKARPTGPRLEVNGMPFALSPDEEQAVLALAATLLQRHTPGTGSNSIELRLHLEEQPPAPAPPSL